MGPQLWFKYKKIQNCCGQRVNPPPSVCGHAANMFVCFIDAFPNFAFIIGVSHFSYIWVLEAKERREQDAASKDVQGADFKNIQTT